VRTRPRHPRQRRRPERPPQRLLLDERARAAGAGGGV